MLVLVHANGFPLDRALRVNVQERIQASFARFDNQIAKVNVYLSDLNGPKKGIDKSVRLVVDLEREPLFVIEHKGEDWTALIETISDRAFQSLSRQIKRSRSNKDRLRRSSGEMYSMNA